MRNINECFNEIQDITPYLKGEEKIDEGLKEIFATVKSKFQQVFLYLKSVVARFGTYFLPTNENGEVMNAISPLTAGAAYVDGSINKKSTPSMVACTVGFSRRNSIKALITNRVLSVSSAELSPNTISLI